LDFDGIWCVEANSDGYEMEFSATKWTRVVQLALLCVCVCNHSFMVTAGCAQFPPSDVCMPVFSITSVIYLRA